MLSFLSIVLTIKFNKFIILLDVLRTMLVTTKMKLLTNDEHHRILKETMIRFNEACNDISHIAFEHKIHSQVKVHKLCYYDVKEKFDLSWQLER